MSNSYFSGTLVQASAQFSDLAGSPVDPTTVTLSYITSTNSTPVVLSYAADELTRDSVGSYHAELDTSGYDNQTADQDWTLQWSGTGECQAVEKDSFQVSAPPV